jgi:hypothetical protein
VLQLLAIDITNSFLKLAIAYFVATAGNRHHFSNQHLQFLLAFSEIAEGNKQHFSNP